MTIPVWYESSATKLQFPNIVEDCVFCRQPTRTWHENTNNPVCTSCASSHQVSDISDDHGHTIRKHKRQGTFDREDSKRAN